MIDVLGLFASIFPVFAVGWFVSGMWFEFCILVITLIIPGFLFHLFSNSITNCGSGHSGYVCYYADELLPTIRDFHHCFTDCVLFED
jgi:hypothetical protein